MSTFSNPPFMGVNPRDLRIYPNQSFYSLGMSGSTNIMDLPTDPAGGGNTISITATEKPMDQSTISQLVNGLQQATTTGATQLASRDMPMNTTNITNDAQTQPNYMPQTNHVDYIKEQDDANDIINQYNRGVGQSDSLDEMYNEIQTPTLLAVLYFLFQLPIFRRYLFAYFPILFSKDGNLNINGFLFNSVLFGLLFYLLNKVTMNFNRF